MKVYKTQEQIDKDIKDGELYVDGDVKFECSFKINASLRVIGDINAHNIDAYDIDANDINACDINANDINANNINACDINANDINANDIKYHAVCFAYNGFKCKSVEGKRGNARHFCLDSEIEYKDEEEDKEPDLHGTEVKVEVNGKTYTATID